MPLNNEARDAIELFWELAGDKEAFPRSLERAAILALPLVIIKLNHLALGSIESWLRSRNIQYSFNCQSRLVRGCLIVFRGKGILFCDVSDSLDEIRFTVAHEISHFLLDCLIPRRKAIQRYGQTIIEVLDGLRQPSVLERVSSLLEGVPIGLNINLMEREGNLNEVWKIEDTADRVALELLAPSADVLNSVNITKIDFATRLDLVTQTLIFKFGLPPSIAEIYAGNLLRSIDKGPSWVEAIRNSL